jgi:hypothetical protein
MQRPRPDPRFRPYSLAPGWPITFEVRCAGGGVALVRGIVDAVAQPLQADGRGTA